jgi:hypothetical protein
LNKRGKIIEDWRNVHKEEFHNLFPSPNKITMIKETKMRWAEHVALTGRRGIHIGFRRESRKERDRYEDLDVDGRIKLKRILDKENGVVFIGLIWLRIGPVEGSREHDNKTTGSIKC